MLSNIVKYVFSLNCGPVLYSFFICKYEDLMFVWMKNKIARALYSLKFQRLFNFFK